MEEKILTPDQVAQILQIHPFTVLKFIKQGRLKASKLGRVYRIRSTDVEKFLDDQTSQSKVKPEPAVRSKQKPNPDQQALEVDDSQQVLASEPAKNISNLTSSELEKKSATSSAHHPHPITEPDHYILG